MRFWLLLVAVSLAWAQRSQFVSRITPDMADDRADTAALSQLSYAPSHYPDMPPAQAVERLLAEQRQAALAGASDRRLSAANREASREIAERNANMEVVRATPDVTALRDRRTGEMFFSFRGTREARDAIPDAQLAVNARRIPRLDEARSFVADVLRENPTPPTLVHLTGHSLGGFIAQGVSQQYPAARTTTLQSATVNRLFRNGNASPRAYNVDDTAMNVRVPVTNFVRDGDVISSAGYSPGISAVFTDSSFGSWNPLSNHRLPSNLPWYVPPTSAPSAWSRAWNRFGGGSGAVDPAAPSQTVQPTTQPLSLWSRAWQSVGVGGPTSQPVQPAQPAAPSLWSRFRGTAPTAGPSQTAQPTTQPLSMWSRAWQSVGGGGPASTSVAQPAAPSLWSRFRGTAPTDVAALPLSSTTTRPALSSRAAMWFGRRGPTTTAAAPTDAPPTTAQSPTRGVTSRSPADVWFSSRATTARPYGTTRRPTIARRTTARRPTTTRRPTSTRRPTTRRASTTGRRTATTRRPAARQ